MPTKVKFHLRPKTKRKCTYSVSAEKRKRKSPDSVFFSFHTFSHQVSPTNAPPTPRPVFLFCRWSCWRDSTFLVYFPTVYSYLCGIFLDDISTSEQFAFLVYCCRVKAFSHNLCTVLYWRLCGLTNGPRFC